jgi:hypothetical protein
MSDIIEILKELKKPFPAADHQERTIPGNSRWFYIPWQKIRERLDRVCPGWEVTYSDPVACEDLVVVRCRITIDGTTREGVGNSEAATGYGTPVERATADAFKNAAEAFGVGAYLDDQAFVIRYLQSQGDGRGVQFAMRDKNGERSQHYKKNSSHSFSPAPVNKNLPTLKEATDLVSTSAAMQAPSEIWRTWKTEADALAWAESQLPHLDNGTLKSMFDRTQVDPITGKKAIAWMQKVQQAGV